MEKELSEEVSLQPYQILKINWPKEWAGKGQGTKQCWKIDHGEKANNLGKGEIS